MEEKSPLKDMFKVEVTLDFRSKAEVRKAVLEALGHTGVPLMDKDGQLILFPDEEDKFYVMADDASQFRDKLAGKLEPRNVGVELKNASKTVNVGGRLGSNDIRKETGYAA